MSKTWMLLGCLAAAALLVRSTIAQEQARAERSSRASRSTAAAPTGSREVHDRALPPASGKVTLEEPAARLEGEKRFRTNCGRCHQPPHKFPPRIMATAIRHMRVRAMITDEDMRYILRYMTQ